MGKNLDEWEGERWLDIRSDNVRKIMQARLELARSKGCNGVEPDNVDGYTNETGFPLTADDQLDYNRFLASEAKIRGLAVGLKNDVDQLEELAGAFDFAVNEQCHEFNECGDYKFFTKNNKPVFNAEYKKSYRTDPARAGICKAALESNIRTLVLPLDLDGTFRYSCDSP